MDESGLVSKDQPLSSGNDDTLKEPRIDQSPVPVPFPGLVDEVVDQQSVVCSVSTFSRVSEKIAIIEVRGTALGPVDLIDVVDKWIYRSARMTPFLQPGSPAGGRLTVVRNPHRRPTTLSWLST
jgi:hypothetical protein